MCATQPRTHTPLPHPHTQFENRPQFNISLQFSMFFFFKVLWHYLKRKFDTSTCGLYYKTFRIVIYNRNAIGQYYKTTIVVMANYDCR
jgi:hypothetical protein